MSTGMQDFVILTGIIIKAEPIGEYDRRVVLLTKKKEKISAFARASRKPGNRLMAPTNPFSFGQFKLFAGRNAYTMSDADISNYFEELRQDFAGAYYGMYFLEICDYYTRENNDEILSAGALIDKNGKVSYWMVGRSKDTMENPGTVYKEKVQKQIAEKRAKKKEEEALKEKKLAKAESVEKLMEQIKAGTSQPVKLQEEGKGAQLDLTI